MKERDQSLGDLIHYRFAMLDNLRYFVEALNTSRSLRKLTICCTVCMMDYCQGPYSPLKSVLSPFEKFRLDVDLTVHLHVADDHEDSSLRTEMVQSPICEQDQAYLEALQSQRSTMQLQSRPHLLEDWISIRAWILSSLPGLQEDGRVVLPFDLPTQLKHKLAMDDYLDEEAFKAIVIRLWHAHASGDVNSFERKKTSLTKAWNTYSQHRKQMLTEGILSRQRSKSF